MSTLLKFITATSQSEGLSAADNVKEVIQGEDEQNRGRHQQQSEPGMGARKERNVPEGKCWGLREPGDTELRSGV